MACSGCGPKQVPIVVRAGIIVPKVVPLVIRNNNSATRPHNTAERYRA